MKYYYLCRLNLFDREEPIGIYTDVNKLMDAYFSQAVVFALTEPDGFGGRGLLEFFTKDHKHYVIGQEGFACSWRQLKEVFPVMQDAQTDGAHWRIYDTGSHTLLYLHIPYRVMWL